MSDRSRDDETSQYREEYPEKDFLEAIRECSVASTTNVATEIGCNRSTALRRLTQLEKREKIASERVGEKAKVWYLLDE
ncbi:winged helix-turn-helix domain-containing protein [Halomontanus rarus]|uniref:winged helix-turn-helix domain-containing protein n=1 Tax=Halomontanus rarus TaxID=3034020 RepID=UPI00307C371D